MVSRLASFRRASRAAQRGLTVYVVVLVIAMLSAVGVFASKSASVALAQGGFVRRATQTHYIAEYAVDATLAAVAGDVPGYVREFEQYDQEAAAAYSGAGAWEPCQTRMSATDNANGRCYKFGRDGLATRFGSGPLIEAGGATSVGTLGTPGSLGRGRVDGNFIVEATDLAQVMAPIAGERSSGAQVAYFAVTFSARANVGPPPSADAEEDALRLVTSSVESARVTTTLGPIPAR